MATRNRKGALVVLSTVSKQADAQRIATTLVNEKLAACVNILGPVRSIYFWQDKTVNDRELLMLIKVPHRNYAALERRLSALHPYEVPEIIALDVAAGAQPFLTWINETAVPTAVPEAPQKKTSQNRNLTRNSAPGGRRGSRSSRNVRA